MFMEFSKFQKKILINNQPLINQPTINYTYSV